MSMYYVNLSYRMPVCLCTLSRGTVDIKPTRRQTALSVLTHNTAAHSLHMAQC